MPGIVRLLSVIPVIFLFALTNIFICLTVSGTVLIELLGRGYNKYFSLGAAILTAVGVYTHMYYFHKTRELMYNNGADNNE
jgi:hypothetical protein